LQDGDCHQYPAKGALVGLAKKGREQLRGCLACSVGLADAVKPKEDCQTSLVQGGGKALGDKKQIALHQPDRNRVAGCFQDAKAGRLGDGLFAAALLLLCLECRIRRGPLLAGVVDGAFGICAHLVLCRVVDYAQCRVPETDCANEQAVVLSHGFIRTTHNFSDLLVWVFLTPRRTS